MRERAVILLYTETYLVLLKEPRSSLPPQVTPSTIFSSSPRQPSQFQLPVPAEWAAEGLGPWEPRDICILKHMA